MAVGLGFLPLVAIGFPSLLQKWVKKKDLWIEVLAIYIKHIGYGAQPLPGRVSFRG